MNERAKAGECWDEPKGFTWLNFPSQCFTQQTDTEMEEEEEEERKREGCRDKETRQISNMEREGVILILFMC